jgi:hypothetical protein
MNNQPTPETDEQFKCFPAYFEIDLFCRKLERERNYYKWHLHIAKGEIEEARKMERVWTIGSIVSPSDKATLELIKVTKERDEVREAIKSTIDWCAERRNAPDHTTLGMVEERLRQALEETNE